MKTSAFPPKFFKGEMVGNEKVYTMINSGIKCGDYVRVQAGFEINKGANSSLYINPNAVEFVGVGEEIVNMPSGAQIFGAAKPAMLPPGVTAPSAVAAASSFAPPAQPNYNVVPQQFAPPAQPQQPAGLPNYAPQSQGMPAVPNFPR
jgi:hypothetical protein